ncbi:uncharacterized protein [Hoplias malabaricus]|uniref:uncharacterized protein n=1 Tax=Hoplias malabaricus TaxID=27720 RepID=UPI00346381CC
MAETKNKDYQRKTGHSEKSGPGRVERPGSYRSRAQENDETELAVERQVAENSNSPSLQYAGPKARINREACIRKGIQRKNCARSMVRIIVDPLWQHLTGGSSRKAPAVISSRHGLHIEFLFCPLPTDIPEQKKSSSPEPSYVSMKSDGSMEPPMKFEEKDSSAEPSSVSMKSDRSMEPPLKFEEKDSSAEPRSQKEKSDISDKTHLKSIFKGLERRFVSLLRKELERCVNLLNSDYPACSEKEEEDEDGFREGVMKITLKLLRNMKHTHLADTLQRKLASVHQKHLKSTLMEKYGRIDEGLPKHETPCFLNEIYTDLYITEGGSGEVNNEHEVRQIETVSRRPAAKEKPIKCSQLFKDKAIRTVLTKGVAGIGKTVSVQKFILDWAEGSENQDVLFIFPFPFRELNLMKEKRFSMMELLHQFFPKVKELKSIDCDSSKVLFIFDGLDECRLPLDFQNNERLWDVTHSASVDVLLTNLINGNLLPSALLWITSRPAAANQIPPECVDQVTEVRGFNDPQKDVYFRKRISDQSLANQIISHIKSSRSLYIMCHIPVFCWISATVLERVLGGAEGRETPKTLTQMFTHFLIFQIKHKEQKYQRNQEVDLQKTRESVLALGKLAFQQLEKGNLIFYEDELRECGIDVREVSVYSGVCTQIFREEFELHLGKVFSFVHLSVQEFLAALYALLSFISRDEPEQSSTDLSGIFRASTMSKFLKSAVDKALQSENGHLDLFLRFLLGLSLESNQTLLQGILTQTGIKSHSTEKTVQYIKEKIRENPSPERSINLFHCLNELGDHSLVQEVQEYLNRGNNCSVNSLRLSPAQWSALVFVLLNSEKELEEIGLKEYDQADECLLKLLPVIAASKKVVLSHCNLTKESCAALASALSSNSSSLTELDLCNNKLQDSGMEQLCAALENPLCKLEKLKLRRCNFSEESCAALASALSSNSSSLRELDLSENELQDSGVQLLSAGLKHPHCKLEKLKFWHCNFSKKSCAVLASVFRSNSSLKELDLRENELQDSGVELLSTVFKNPKYKMRRLSFELQNEFLWRPVHRGTPDVSEQWDTRNLDRDSSAELGCVFIDSDRSMSPPQNFREGDSSPEPSCVSMKSDQSMSPPQNFRERDSSPEPSCVSMKSDQSISPPQNFRERDISAEPSCVSMKSDQSISPPQNFRERDISAEPSCVSMKSDQSISPPQNFRERDSSPEPSCVSMKSDQSMSPPQNFRERDSSPEPSCVSMKSDQSISPPQNFRERDISAEPSCVSMKSDQSISPPQNFRERDSSPEPSCVSMKSDQSMRPPQNFRERDISAEPSCVSMKSDQSMSPPQNFRERDSSPEPNCVSMKRDQPISPPQNFRERDISAEPSCVSMKSDQSMSPPQNSRERDSSAEPSCVFINSDRSMSSSQNFRERDSFAEPSCVSMKSDWSVNRSQNLNRVFVVSVQHKESKITNTTHLESIFKLVPDQDLEQRLVFLPKKKRSVKLLSSDYPACSEREEEEDGGVGEGVMKITMKLTRNVDTLQRKLDFVHQKHLKATLMEKSRRINEGLSQHGISPLLHKIYTDLYITEGGSGEVNIEHEVRQIETVSRRPAAQEKPIKCSQLFKDKAIRTVLTKGVAGIGKTVSVQKFILDWAEGKENQDVLFIFPLPFRELNLMKEKRLSLMELLHQFFPKIKELKSIDCDCSKVLFIFDGLDECRLPLDFQNNERLWDVIQSASVDVLLTNLIKGNLLPSALLWITSRPAAANQIPPECVAQVTEVRGFSDPQKEEYFRKRISDQSLANHIISHIKSSRSLYIMCHIPVFCWISATVLEGVLGGAEGGEAPKTLTQMFTHFLIFQIKHKEQKYQGNQEVDLQKTRESVLALGKLAFQQLEKGNLIFYEDDLSECGIDVREVSVYSGVCTQIFREEFGLHLGKVFSFVHLSVQEFLAALYAFLSFISRDEPEESSTDLSGIFRASTMSKFLKCAVDKALQSKNGHLDLFLRFLLGFSLESNQTPLQGILTQTGIRSHSTEETLQYIKEMIRENSSPETSINLFHCLNELGDHSLEQEVQKYLNRGDYYSLSGLRLSPAQWSALVFVLLNSEEDLEEFKLNKYNRSEECLLKLLPVVKVSRRANYWCSNLTEKSCAALASALSSKSSCLRELDLGENGQMKDLGVELLCAGLENLHCKLETLGLRGCNLSARSCAALASPLSSNSSCLRELDLSHNELQDSGVKLLCATLENPHCKLETLMLCDCNLTEKSCTYLASALSSISSSLRELDLSGNKQLKDSGVKLLCVGLKNPHCKLEKLLLSGCSITGEGFAALASALESNPSHLRELNLVSNNPGELGKKLSDIKEDPFFKLEKLELYDSL